MSNKLDRKSMLLQRYSQTDIFLNFLGISAVPKSNISSPFSDDKTPSFRLYPKTNTFKCNSSGFQGDCFEFVALLNKLSSKYHFANILQIIENKMSATICNPSETLPPTTTTPKDEFFTVNVTGRLFTPNDAIYWRKLGITKEILKQYKVTSIANYKFFSIAKHKNFSFNIIPEKLCFGYQIGANFEVYVPEQPHHQQPKMFINGLSHSDIFGFEQLHGVGGENIIICAGKKDTLSLVSRGFKAVSFRSETHHPTKTQIEILQKFCTNLFICYDADKGGDIGSSAIIQRFPFIKRIELPPHENIKGFDVTDYFLRYDKWDFQKLIDLAVKI